MNTDEVKELIDKADEHAQQITICLCQAEQLISKMHKQNEKNFRKIGKAEMELKNDTAWI